MIKIDLYECKDCNHIGVSELLKCPRCGGSNYSYRSDLRK